MIDDNIKHDLDAVAAGIAIGGTFFWDNLPKFALLCTIGWYCIRFYEYRKHKMSHKDLNNH